MKRFPHHTARARLASFPLGNISPQSSWMIVQTCPCSKSAEVPPISDSNLPILTSSSLMLSELFWQNQIVRMQVMILVSDATSWLFLLLYETTTLKFYSVSLVQHMMQDLAVILGGGLKGFAQFLLISFMRESLAFFYYSICFWLENWLMWLSDLKYFGSFQVLLQTEPSFFISMLLMDLTGMQTTSALKVDCCGIITFVDCSPFLSQQLRLPRLLSLYFNRCLYMSQFLVFGYLPSQATELDICISISSLFTSTFIDARLRSAAPLI